MSIHFHRDLHNHSKSELNIPFITTNFLKIIFLFILFHSHFFYFFILFLSNCYFMTIKQAVCIRNKEFTSGKIWICIFYSLKSVNSTFKKSVEYYTHNLFFFCFFTIFNYNLSFSLPHNSPHLTLAFNIKKSY